MHGYMCIYNKYVYVYVNVCSHLSIYIYSHTYLFVFMVKTYICVHMRISISLSLSIYIYIDSDSSSPCFRMQEFGDQQTSSCRFSEISSLPVICGLPIWLADANIGGQQPGAVD